MASSRRNSVSHRDVAEACGVSQSTVSRALRNDSRISEEVRDRVRDAAYKMGYRPDPQFDLLMARMRMRREKSLISLVAFILPPPSQIEAYYSRTVRASARQRLEQLGYVVEEFRIDSTEADCRWVNRIIRAKNMLGAIVFSRQGPLPEPGIDWSVLAPVAVSESIHEPVHHVTPDNQSNSDLLLAKIERRRFTRPGLVITSMLEHLMRAAPVAMMLRFYENKRLPKNLSSIFRLRDDKENQQDFERWLGNLKPDVLLVPNEDIWGYVQLPKEIFGRGKEEGLPQIFFARPGEVVEGIDQRPDQIGRAAADLVSAQILHGEKGLPACPLRVTIPGRWVGPSSTPGSD